MCTPLEADATLKGKLAWTLLVELDNANNQHTESIVRNKLSAKVSRAFNAGQFVERVRTETQSQSFKKSLKLGKDNASIKPFYNPVSASASVDHEAYQEVKDYLRHVNNMKAGASDGSIREIKEEKAVELNCAVYRSIGPGDRLLIYQRVFTAPGYFARSDVYKTTTAPVSSSEDIVVDIKVRVKPVEFIKDVKAVHGDIRIEAPSDRIREYKGESDDLNHLIPGKYVWISPVYTWDVDEAATSFEVHALPRSIPGYKDVGTAKDPEFRYIVPHRDSRNPSKIVKLALVRASDSLAEEDIHDKKFGIGPEWTGASGDLNGLRPIKYLHIIWATRSTS